MPALSLTNQSSSLLAAILLAALIPGCGSDARQVGPNAVLITLDTTRADALGVYGGQAGLTPHLDALAEESIVFLQARTVTPQTLPSHSSMLTGLYPPRHTVRVNNMQLPPAAETLAERARQRGVQTAAIVASVALEGGTGIAQGFEVFDQPEAPAFQAQHQFEDRPGHSVTQAALEWLGNRDKQRPFFLWVHYFDPHFPYRPPADFAASNSRSAYLGEVAAMDAQVGRLLDVLRADGLLEQTTVVVVADHGEGLGDHGERSHGELLWDSTVRVPLLVRYPDGRQAGERSNALVSVVDVFPTLLAALDLGDAPDIDGLSLDAAEHNRQRGVYFEALNGSLNFGWSPLVGWMDSGGKYLHSSSPLFFNPREDPGESAPLDRAAEPYLVELARIFALPTLPSADHSNADPERVAELQRLGYAAGGELFVDQVDPLAPTNKPAPHLRMGELDSLYEAQIEIQAGQDQLAMTRLERIVADNPYHANGLYELGQLYRRLGRPEDAVRVLNRAIGLGVEWYAPYANLGYAHFSIALRDQSTEHLSLAEGHIRRALELHPRLEPMLEVLIRILDMRHREDEAEALREQLAGMRQD